MLCIYQVEKVCPAPPGLRAIGATLDHRGYQVCEAVRESLAYLAYLDQRDVKVSGEPLVVWLLH